MKTLLQLIREFWLPLLLSVGWTFYNLASKPVGDLTLRETLNVFGPTFFFMCWLVAQWYRVKKQQRVEDGLSGIQIDVQKLKTVTDLIVYCLAHPEAKVTPKYDEKGSVCGLYVDMQANITGGGDIKA